MNKIMYVLEFIRDILLLMTSPVIMLMGVVFTIFLLAIIIILFIFAIYVPFVLGDYYLDKSMCNVIIDGKSIINTRCHFVSVDSIGENGNSKHVIIFKDILCLQPIANYISNDVVVKEVQDGTNNN